MEQNGGWSRDTSIKNLNMKTHLKTCTLIIINHLPTFPHIFWADNSNKTSQYSTTVSHSFKVSPELGISNWRTLLMIRSLRRTTKFERQYTSSDKTCELLIFPVSDRFSVYELDI